MDTNKAEDSPEGFPKGSKIIRIACEKDLYEKAMDDSQEFKSMLADHIKVYPELFPAEIHKGYSLYGKGRCSKKLDNLQFQRIKIKTTGEIFSVYPAFVMPYLIAYTADVDKALILRKHDVPYSTLVYIFGKDEMYWYRAEQAFSHCSIVGTSVKKKELLPKHIAADEKHSKRLKDKVYVATTVAGECMLGAEVCADASEKSLTAGYSVFADEAKNIAPDYAPESVNTDGWEATQIAFSSLFLSITIIRCFLHGFIKIRDCCRTSPMFGAICSQIWHVYKASSKQAFSQRMRRFKEWAMTNLEPSSTALAKILSLHSRSSQYQVAYDHPEGYRTSNMCDRLMRLLDRSIFTRQKFHGKLSSANDAVRSWAILRNYYPYCLRKTKSKHTFSCAASELNGFKYSDNWLVNLVAASSMNGYRQ